MRLGRLGRLVVGREEAQQLERPQAGVEPARLQHHADLRAEAAAVAHRVEAEHAHRAGVGPAVALEDLDRRGLARAVGAEQPEHLAGADLEVERRRPRASIRTTCASAATEIAGSAAVTAQESRHATYAASSSSQARAVVDERRGGERGARFDHEPVDRRLHVVERAGAHEQRLQRGDVGLGEVGRAELGEQLAVALGRAGARDRDERRRLALAEVVAHRLAGDRRSRRTRRACRRGAGTPHPSAGRSPRARRRARRSGRRARRRDAAAARPCTSPTCRSRCGGRSAASVRAVAVPTRSSDWPTHSSMRSSSKIVCAASGAPRRSMSAYTSAKSPMRIAMPSPKRRAGPAPRLVFVLAGELAVHGVAAAAGLGAVHDVVVHEREGVHELERGRGVDHGRIVERRRPRRRTRTRRTPGAAACRRRPRTRAARRADRRARRRPRSSASARW